MKRLFVLIISGFLLNACGGGGSSSTPDQTAPVITLLGDNPLEIGLSSTFNDPGAIVTDNIDSSLSATVTGTVNTLTTGTYTLNYNVTDTAGNSATTVNRIIHVVDQTAPVITLLGDNSLVISLNSTFNDFGVTVTDNLDNSLSASVTGSVDTSTAGTYILTYNATDLAGNTATPVNRTVQVASVQAPRNVGITTTGKHLNFVWASSTLQDHFRILENSDGNSGFTVVPSASNIAGSETEFSLEIPTHKTNWLSASYIVESCDVNETQCFAASSLPLSLIDSIAATFYVKASNTGKEDIFGWFVTLSGDGNTLAVAAPQEASVAIGIGGNQVDNTAEAGAVYVFVRSGVTWTQQAYVKASNTGAGDNFGVSVMLSSDGDTLAVGAYLEDSAATGINGNQQDNSASQAGAVYIFTRSGVTWTQQAYLKASNTDAGDFFGRSVTISGDGNTLAVGATLEDSSATGIGGNQADNSAGGSGAVYIFTRSGVTWTQQTYLKASNTDTDDGFGSSGALSWDGDTLAIGVGSEDSAATGIDGNQADDSLLNPGAVYVFTRSGTIWTQHAYVKASNTGDRDNFGVSVTLSSDGNTLAVGASQEDSAATGIDGNQADNSAGASGAVYVFTRSGSFWTQQAYLKSSNTEMEDLFGTSVMLSADSSTLAVGAVREASAAIGIGGIQADNSKVQSGAVYLFTRSGLTWIQQSYVKATNTDSSDSFGQSVALNSDGNTLAVGAFVEGSSSTGIGGNQADNSEGRSGAVYVY